MLSRWLVVVCPFAGILSAQPITGFITLTLDHVTVSTPPGQTGLTYKVSTSKNSFTVSMESSRASGTGTSEYTLDLPNQTFTSVNPDLNLFSVTPSAMFQGKLSVTGTGSASQITARINLGVALRRGPCPTNFVTTSNLDFTCELTTLAREHLILANQNLAVVGTDIRVGGANLEVSAYYSYIQKEFIEFVPGSIQPKPEDGLPGSPVTFKARVKYNFISFPTAQAVLRLYDKDTGGTFVASSDFKNAPRPSGELDLEIPGFEIKDDTPSPLYLQAVLIDVLNATARFRTASAVFEGLPDVSIDHLELVQTVQNERGSVSPIAGKETILRVFVKQKGGLDDPFTKITATIKAKWNGVEIPGRPYLTNENKGITAHEYPDRKIQTHSLNYVLNDLVPATATSDKFTYEVELQLPPGRAEGPKENNKKTVEVVYGETFTRKSPLTIGIAHVCVDGVCPKENYAPISYIDTLERMLPVANLGLKVERFDQDVPWPPPPEDEITQALQASGHTTFDLYQGSGRQALNLFLQGMIGDTYPILGMGLIPALPPKGGNTIPAGEAIGIPSAENANPDFDYRTFFVQDSSPASSAAHEIGHLMGLYHTRTEDSCGQELEGKTNWLPQTAAIGDPGFEFDAGGLWNFVPATTKDLMSYCSPRWPSVYTYLYTLYGFAEIAETVKAGAKEGGEEQPKAAAKDGRRHASGAHVTIAGIVNQDAGTGVLLNTYASNGAFVPAQHDPLGNYCLRFTGAVERSHCFQIGFLNVDGKPNPLGCFSRALALPPGTTRVVLFRGDTQLASLGGSSRPTVQFNGLQAGAKLQGTQTIRWSGSDSSGGALTYTLQYSPDGGNTWKILRPSTTATSYSLVTGNIAGGANVYFRILASNGLQSTPADVGPVEIVQNPKLGGALPALDFGNMQVGRSAALTVPIQNAGDGLLTVPSATVDSVDFEVLSVPASVRAGQTGGLVVRFLPRSAGTKAGLLTIATSDRATPTYTIPLSGKAFDNPVPNIVVTPGSLNFGAVETGKSKDAEVIVSNTGTDDLNITSLALSSAAFTTTAPGAFTLTPGTQRTLSLTFRPAAAGAATATFTVNSNDPTVPATRISLAGSGVTPTTGSGPRIEVSPASLDFGTVAAGQSKLLSMTVRNTGTAALRATTVTSSTRFPTTPATFNLDPGAQQSVSVTFRPDSAAAQSATLTISSNDASKPDVVVPLSGNGAGGGVGGCASSTNIARSGIATQSGQDYSGPPNLGNNGVTNEPNGYGFHTAFVDNPWWKVELKELSTICEVRLFNRYDVSAERARTIRVLLSTNGTDFTTAYAHDGSMWGTTAAPMVLTSQVANKQAKFVRVQLAEPNYLHLQEVEVYGAGSTGGGSPAISITPTGLDFGSVAAGSSPTKTVTIGNTGAAPLAVTSITGAAPFTVSPASIASIAVGASAAVTVTFSPTAAGAVSRSLTIASNDPAKRSMTVAVTGSGGAASGSIVVTPTSLEFGSVAAGQTKSMSVTVRNTGTTALNMVSTSNTPRFTVTPFTYTLNPGAEQPVFAIFRPEAPGTQTGVLTVSSDNPAVTPVNVSLTGTAPGTVNVLQVDDGTHERKLGAAGDLTFVNRLTPTKYPATLKAVQIYFHADGDGLPLGHTINILSAANATGTANIDPPRIQLRSAANTVQALGRFFEYTVPPITIISGDFVVGFSARAPSGTFPMVTDTSSSKARSYLSTNGENFYIVDTIEGITPGNFFIRAVLE